MDNTVTIPVMCCAWVQMSANVMIATLESEMYIAALGRYVINKWIVSVLFSTTARVSSAATRSPRNERTTKRQERGRDVRTNLGIKKFNNVLTI